MKKIVSLFVGVLLSGCATTMADFEKAVRAADLKGVQAAMAAGLSPNTCDVGKRNDSNIMELAASLHNDNKILNEGETEEEFRRRQVEVMKYLIANGGDVNAVCYDAAPPLHGAVLHQHPELVKVLLDAGADPSWTSDYGQCLLFTAVNSQCGECVTMLIDKGADLTVRDKVDGRTPRETAEALGYKDILSRFPAE